MSDPKPCPFCGETPTDFPESGDVVCTTEGCAVQGRMISREEWDRRTPPSGEPR